MPFKLGNRWRGRKLSTCFPLSCGEWVRSLIIEYPFIKHFPIVIVMSMSHLSGCAMIHRAKGSRDATFFDWSEVCFARCGARNSALLLPGSYW